MNKYECPICNKSSPSESWNKKTILNIGEDYGITPIKDAIKLNKLKCYFVCPKCEEIVYSHKKKLIESGKL